MPDFDVTEYFAADRGCGDFGFLRALTWNRNQRRLSGRQTNANGGYLERNTLG